METRKYNTLCSNCGAHRSLEYTVEDGLPVHSNHGRECTFCKKLTAYITTPFGNYGLNLVGILQRIRALEKRVKELEGNVRPCMPETTTDIPRKG